MTAEEADDYLRWASIILNGQVPIDSELYERAVAETVGPEAAEKVYRHNMLINRVDAVLAVVAPLIHFVAAAVWMTAVLMYLLNR